MIKSDIQTYINNFRRHIAVHLRPGIGINARVLPADEGGAILEFKIGPNIENDDVYESPKPNLGIALAGIDQHAFGGNVSGFRFGGTNTILEKDRIIFIKDNNRSEWSDAAAAKDVNKLFTAGAGGSK